MIKPYEFWHPRLFELPYYVYLGWQCLRHAVSIKSLAKANYGLDHGEIGLGSKYQSQLAFDQRYFLPTELLRDQLSLEEKRTQVVEFVESHGFPVILKSDVGCVGKGICKIESLAALDEKLPLLIGDYILQKFTDYPYECGIFFTRYRGEAKISGINQKHFPEVAGNGKDTVLALAKAHPRYTHHWHAFLQNIDTSRIPADGEKVRLSFIGSHTLGCMFTDDTHLLTPLLREAIVAVFASQPGFNFGRVDVKAASQEALLQGDFVVIEVNGVASLPTHMFDPKFSAFDAYKIFFKHAQYLVKIAKEHRDQPMELLPYKDIIQRVKHNQGMLNQVHEKLKH